MNDTSINTSSSNKVTQLIAETESTSSKLSNGTPSSSVTPSTVTSPPLPLTPPSTPPTPSPSTVTSPPLPLTPPSTPPTPSRLVITGLVFSSIFVGCVVSLQVLVNSRLGQHFNKTTIWATFWSFFSGQVLLTIMCYWEAIETRTPFLTNFWQIFFSLKWWMTLPGMIGVAFVSCGNAVSPQVGFSLFWVSVVVGQLSISALLDHIALFGSKRVSFNLQTGFFLSLAVLGAGLSVADGLVSNLNRASIGTVLGCSFGSIAAGAGMPLQAAINRRTTLFLKSRLQSTWWSFFFGTSLSFIILVITLLTDIETTRNYPEYFATSSPILYIGGIIGVFYVWSALTFTQTLGSALYFVSLISGQLVGSAVLDSIGAFGAPIISPGIYRSIGIVLVLISAISMQLRVSPSNSASIQNQPPVTLPSLTSLPSTLPSSSSTTTTTTTTN
jgi:bacterial/archaeal transporter family-2 protein